MLDYGCAKASTIRALLGRCSDLDVHLYDVSEMYLEFWREFVAPAHWATYSVPPDWLKRFDVVTSFFAFEHIVDPLRAAREVRGLLKPGGTFYGIVPDLFGNVADLVVVDHVNHFTRPSLDAMLRSAGFGDIDIDDRCHRGALVFKARAAETGAVTGPGASAAPFVERARELGAYWSAAISRLREFEREHSTMPAAIYGSGFYGSFILASLRRIEPVRCFLDRNPFQQGKTMFGRRVLAPECLPSEVDVVYVGLNPAIARRSIAEVESLQSRAVEYFYF